MDRDAPARRPRSSHAAAVAGSPPGLWAGQLLHLSCLAALLAGVWAGWTAMHRPFPFAFWIAVAFPVIHQVYVWLTWRLELQASWTSRTLGLRGYVAWFFLLLCGRLASLLVLAWVDRGSLGLQPVPRVLATTALALPGLYALHSVRRHFGFFRAAGADHFVPRYRDMPLVKDGIFRFASNGMYTCGFLLLWAIAMGLNSRAAVAVAAFSHVYIWVHFHATERPDMDFLYGSEH